MGTPAQFTWQPSTARVVTPDGFGPFPRGTWQSFPTPLSWPVKDPGDTLDYIVDFSRALAGDTGDTISTLDVSISPNSSGDVIVSSSRVDGHQAVIWLSAGFSGTTYGITVVVTTNSGRTLSRTIGLSVLTLSIPAPFGTQITTQAGAPITDQTGSPITTN